MTKYKARKLSHEILEFLMISILMVENVYDIYRSNVIIPKYKIYDIKITEHYEIFPVNFDIF